MLRWFIQILLHMLPFAIDYVRKNPLPSYPRTILVRPRKRLKRR